MKYCLTGEEGPDHDKRFFVTVELNGKPVGSGQGSGAVQLHCQAAWGGPAGPAPDPDVRFVTVELNGKPVGSGQGHSKKLAEQMAAKAAFQKLNG